MCDVGLLYDVGFKTFIYGVRPVFPPCRAFIANVLNFYEICQTSCGVRAFKLLRRFFYLFHPMSSIKSLNPSPLIPSNISIRATNHSLDLRSEANSIASE